MTSFIASLTGRVFMSPRDIGLFLRSARTDAKILDLRADIGQVAAFDTVYRAGDPWASADPRYLYQRRKQETLLTLLPQRRYASALDLGAGLGQMSRLLAGYADSVLGIDISAEAVKQARASSAHVPGLRFEQGDVLDLPAGMDGGFDLLVLADTLYYLPPPLTDATLKATAQRLARLLRPGGTCLLANHYFSGLDADSRLTRRIHQAFAWSPSFGVVAEYRRPFYLASVLRAA